MLYLGIRFDIDFNIGSFIIFISGVIFGLFIFGLLYLYFTLRTLKDKKYYVESELENTIKEEEIKEIISSYQEKYLNQRKDVHFVIIKNGMIILVWDLGRLISRCIFLMKITAHFQLKILRAQLISIKILLFQPLK